MKIDKLTKKRLRQNVLEELEKRGKFKPRQVKVATRRRQGYGGQRKKKLTTVSHSFKNKKAGLLPAIKMVKPLLQLPVKASRSRPIKDKSPIRKKIVALIVVILLVIVAFGIDVLVIYKMNLQDPFSLQMSKLFQLSAGEVNGQKIMLADYIASNKALEKLIIEEREGVGNIWIGGDYGKKVFNTLVVESLIDQELKKYGINGVNIMVNEELTSLIEQSGDLKTLKLKVKAVYGVKLNDFLDYIVKPLKKRQLLTLAVLNSDSNSLKDKAEDILTQLKLNQVSFKDAASEYSDDEVGINTGGDMGWFVRGELPEELEQKLFNLDDNELYPEVVKNDRGYHIFKVSSKLYNPEDGSESIRLGHIFFELDLNEYIKEMFDSAEILKYIE